MNISYNNPKKVIKVLKESESDSSDLALLYHQLLINSCTLSIDELNSKEIYSIIISTKTDFRTKSLSQPLAYLKSFQYKILNNVLYLNKKLDTFGLSNMQLCSFCKMEEETIIHLFYYCIHIQDIWNQVQAYFTDYLHFFTVNTADCNFWPSQY